MGTEEEEEEATLLEAKELLTEERALEATEEEAMLEESGRLTLEEDVKDCRFLKTTTPHCGPPPTNTLPSSGVAEMSSRKAVRIR